MNDQLREALDRAHGVLIQVRVALRTLDVDVLGVVPRTDDCDAYPVRDEMIHNVSRAIVGLAIQLDDADAAEETKPNRGTAAEENAMETNKEGTATLEVTFPHEARERIASQHETINPPRDGDESNRAIGLVLRDAMEVIEHLESDAAAYRATIENMRLRVTEAIEAR